MALTKENLSSDTIRTIKELILDEQKLVTYVSLSKELCIHVNEAKILLRKVLDEIKENDPSINLHITYIVSGLTSNNSGLTTVCPESELETRKNDFKTVFFQHIYSACRGSSGTDNAAFVCINKFEDILLCAGLIKGTSCCKRSSDEIGSLKSNSQKPVDEEKPTLPIKKDKPTENPSKSKGVVKVHETKSEPVIKSEAISPKKDLVSSVNGKSNIKNGMKPSKGIAGFFTKSNSVPSTKSSNVKETVIKPEPKVEQKKEKESKSNIKKEDDMEVDVETPIIETKKEAVSAKKTNNKKNSSLSVIKKNAKVDKKRKRVLHVSDSESDEDNDPFADEKNETPVNPESDDEIPPTPSVNTVKITSGILNPKKKRKIVDKTYTDEEGYILTRKEEVYESCSDEEMEAKTEPVQVKSEKENVELSNKVKTEVSPKEKKTKNTKKKASPPQKGKQANIMNFFKKI